MKPRQSSALWSSANVSRSAAELQWLIISSPALADELRVCCVSHVTATARKDRSHQLRMNWCQCVHGSTCHLFKPVQTFALSEFKWWLKAVAKVTTAPHPLGGGKGSAFQFFDAWKKLKTNPLYSQSSFVVSSKVQHYSFIGTYINCKATWERQPDPEP